MRACAFAGKKEIMVYMYLIPQGHPVMDVVSLSCRWSFNRGAQLSSSESGSGSDGEGAGDIREGKFVQDERGILIICPVICL